MNVRCFTAVLLPADIRHAIALSMPECGSALHNAGAPAPRWEREENLHCTLNFFGSVDETLIAPFIAGAHAALREIQPFSIEIADFGTFPAGHAPRVLWVGIGDVDGRLQTAQAALTASAKASCLNPAEEHAFHPHVTIGRWKNEHSSRHALPDGVLARKSFGSVRIQSITLMKSTTTAGGSVYSPLHAWDLQIATV